MSPSLDVRELRPTDLEGWTPLWKGYTRFYRAEFDGLASEGVFRRLCNGDDSTSGLVAVDRDQLVGLSNLVIHANTWSSKPTCYLQDLFVATASRGSGVGARLIEAVYEAARKRGADQVYWHTQQFNASARSLYDSVGCPTSFVVYEQKLD